MQIKYMVKVAVKCTFTDYKGLEREYREKENFCFKQEQEAKKFIESLEADNTIILQCRTGCITSITVSKVEKLQEIIYEVE